MIFLKLSQPITTDIHQKRTPQRHAKIRSKPSSTVFHGARNPSALIRWHPRRGTDTRERLSYARRAGTHLLISLMPNSRARLTPHWSQIMCQMRGSSKTRHSSQNTQNWYVHTIPTPLHTSPHRRAEITLVRNDHLDVRLRRCPACGKKGP